MNEIITEKKYPIQIIWIIKDSLTVFFILFCYSLFWIGDDIIRKKNFSLDSYFSIFPFLFLVFLLFSIPSIFYIFRCSNFHYSLEKKFMVFYQGVISKQNLTVPYGRIQEVFLRQILFDKFFNLTSLTISHLSQGGDMLIMRDRHYAPIGFIGDKINIHGLKKEDAKALKKLILQKMKENPIEDSQSGL
ncbi:MAG: PH domain-containing protein [bacterium]